MTNEIAKKSVTPSYLEKYKKATHDVNVEDMQIPMIKIVQGSNSKDFSMEKANLGHFINSISKEDYGTEMTVIIVKPFKQWAKFKRKEDKGLDGIKDGALLGKSYDGVRWSAGTLKGQALSEEEGWKCLQYNFFVLVKHNGKLSKLPASMAMGNTSAKEGRALFTSIGLDNADGVPCFAREYKIRTIPEKSDQGNFYLFKFEKIDGFVEESIAEYAEQMRNIIDKSNIVIDGEVETSHATQSNTKTEEEPAY